MVCAVYRNVAAGKGISCCETAEYCAERERKVAINMEKWEREARWEPLGKGCRVLVTKEHGFTTDTLLLADFSLPGKGKACADFGTGCGTIPLLWKLRGEPGPVYGVELQEQGVRQARRSVEENGFSREITVLHGDVREIKRLFSHQQLDLIACNPPYQAAGAGLVNENAQRRTARHGETLTLKELACSARYALKQGGRLCLCLRTERLAEAMAVFRETGLEPKRLRLVQQRAGKAPYLFLLECRSGGRSGITVEPVLFLEDGVGKPSAELERIYGNYRENGKNTEKGKA